MKEGEYLEEVNNLKKQYEEKEQELDESNKLNEFLKIEIIKVYGTLKLVSDSMRNESCEISNLFSVLEFLLNRSEYLYEMLITETEPLSI